MRRITLPLVVLILWMVLAVGAADAFAQKSAPAGMGWWNDRVFYEVFVRSFADGDGDGIGDLKGLISKLDYLNDGNPATKTDLGVTGIWLMPIMQSPTYHGYDVLDYRQVEQDYGTNEDFKQLMAGAHKRGIAVIVDMVLNHTSSENPWFKESQKPGSPYNNWYIWQNTNPGYPGPWGQQVWYALGDRFYYAVFWSGMPDLNYRHPAVTQEMYDIARFWLQDMGADGFRLDAPIYLVETGIQLESSSETHTWFQDYQRYLVSLKPDVMTVGEVWKPAFVAGGYVQDKSFNLAFDFDLAGNMLSSVQSGFNMGIISGQKNANGVFPPGQYAAFLTNHDQDRAFYEVGRDFEKAKVAATLLLTTTGVPFIYYGEEIGMIGKKPDECIRTPMQWEATFRTLPFMDGKNCTTNPDKANVAEQTDDPNSLLSHYRNLIHLRNEHPVLRTGQWQLVESDSNKLYSFIRYTPEETLLVLVNLSVRPVDGYMLKLPKGPFKSSPSATIIMGEGKVIPPTINTEGGFADYRPLPELAPHGTLVIKLG
jgi:glycosidase